MLAEKKINRKVAIAGANGFLGKALTSHLRKRGMEVVCLSRGLFEECEGDVVINLAGESIMGRWSQKKKERIKESRIQTTKRLCQKIDSLLNPPSLYIGASAIGFYGDRGNEILTEASMVGRGFLSEVCQQWEESAQLAKTKVVHARFGVVLSSEGGALKKILPVFKKGLGGVLGSGKQYMSWISLTDFLHAMVFLIERELEGVVNVAAPFPVTNEEFTKELGEAIHKPTVCGVPAFFLKFLYGEAAEALFLSSTRAVPARLEKEGFHFVHQTLRAFFTNL